MKVKIVDGFRKLSPQKKLYVLEAGLNHYLFKSYITFLDFLGLKRSAKAFRRWFLSSGACKHLPYSQYCNRCYNSYVAVYGSDDLTRIAKVDLWN